MQYVSEKVKVWVSHSLSLTKVADKEPQATYATLTKSFQHEWTFLQHVICSCDSSFFDLESTIFFQFCQSCLGVMSVLQNVNYSHFPPSLVA